MSRDQAEQLVREMTGDTMGKPLHYKMGMRTIPAGTLATICAQNPLHPEATAFMKMIDSIPATQMVHPIRARVQAVQENRECLEVRTPMGGGIEITYELGELLNNQTQTGVSAEGEQDVTSADDDSGGGCC